MKICLISQGKDNAWHPFKLTLSTRLPLQINGPCELDGKYRVSKMDSYYLLNYHLQGQLSVTCQRCLHFFMYDYHHENTVAVCNNETQAENLLSQYETIVERAFLVDLNELVIDELHLSVLQKHSKIEECDKLVSTYIS